MSVDAIERHAKFLGDQLYLRRGHALTDLFLAGVRGDAAVRSDGDPRIDFIGWRRIRSRSSWACASSVASTPPMLKLTISAPVPCKKDLRENPERFKAASASEVREEFVRGCVIWFSSRHFLSRTLDCPEHSRVRETTA